MGTQPTTVSCSHRLHRVCTLGGRFDASFRIFRERHGARATKIPSGVPPGPAGVVLVNTFFWKILVTRVNGKIRGASGFDHIRLKSSSAKADDPVIAGLDEGQRRGLDLPHTGYLMPAFAGMTTAGERGLPSFRFAAKRPTYR